MRRNRGKIIAGLEKPGQDLGFSSLVSMDSGPYIN